VDWLQIDAIVGITLTALGGFLGLIKWISRKTSIFEKKFDSFMRDWGGEPAAPGRDAVPGVMERLNNIDGELKHNGGSTMKDAMQRIEHKLDTIDARLLEGDSKFTQLESRIEGLEGKEK
jgi:hypothetical protein